LPTCSCCSPWLGLFPPDSFSVCCCRKLSMN
jgi:hypothetical protein